MAILNFWSTQKLLLGSFWALTYGSWIYNYLYNQCISPLTWVSEFVLNTTLYDEDCQWLTTGWWFSQGTSVSSTNNTDRHDIAEILLKVALITNNHSPKFTQQVSLEY
jgi:hypothetical protein